MKREISVYITLTLVNFLLIFSFSQEAGAQVKVEEGVLDLRSFEISNKVIKLNGEWEFYWQKQLAPGDFSKDTVPVPDTWGRVPGYWIKYADEIPGIENMGYATYRMNILFPDNISEVVFEIPVFDSSFRIYIDGKYAGSNGIAGKSEAGTKPAYKPFTYRHRIINGSTEIIVNVSNYHHRRGGFWMPIKVGMPEVVMSGIERQKSMSGISAGILLAFATFFFVFFIILRANDAMLFFALAATGILIRSISTGYYLIMTYMDISWTNLVRLEYTGSFIALVFGSWYFHRIFPNKYFKILCTVISVLFGAAIIFVMTTPVIVFSHTIRIFMPALLLVLLYYGLMSINSLLKTERKGILNTIGFLALLIGATNDLTLSTSNTFLFSYYILPYATIIFIFMQVIILIISWVNSINEEKRLLSELEYVNLNLENMVRDRTSELARQKSELERQKEEIEKKNIELETNINIKDRVFSIIAHDLRTPVVDLAMLIEGAGSRSRMLQGDMLSDEAGRQVDFTLNLIDNLIIWGKAQQNQIDYRPAKYNITDIVLECFNLLNVSAEDKKIQLSYSHRGSPEAWCDPDLVSVILKNLLTNSIKFTPEKGKISVSVEEITDVHPHYIRVSVRDTGLGIDYNRLEQLRKNTIVESTPGTRGEKGTGLGIQLCHDLVKISRGEMEIKSTKGEGTTISFTLPVQSWMAD
jgi:signal transduction histidine kinase